MLGTVTEPVAEDWERRYLAHLRAVRAGALTIRPPWLEGSPEDLVIDPDTTFGAGTHESTRLSLELLQRIEPGGAAVRLGRRQRRAVDRRRAAGLRAR